MSVFDNYLLGFITNNTPILTTHNIKKNFGNIQALRGIDLEIFCGEILAIVGDNGSGKSTFIKILSGDIRPDEGTITIEDEAYRYLTSKQSLSKGISTVYQDLALDDYRDVAANIFLGNEITIGKIFLNRKKMKSIAEDLIKDLNIGIPDITLPVGSFSGGQRQAVAVARAVYHGKKLIIFDEPTAAMGVRESSAVLKLIEELSKRNMAIIIICHNLHQVFEIADKICIMRHGKTMKTINTSDTTLLEVQSIIEETNYID